MSAQNPMSAQSRRSRPTHPVFVLVSLALLLSLTVFAPRPTHAQADQNEPQFQLLSFTRSVTTEQPVPVDEPSVTEIELPTVGTIADIAVRVNIDHARTSDLRLQFVLAGQRSVLSGTKSIDGYGTGSAECSADTTVQFTDAAATPVSDGLGMVTGPVRPDQPLARITGASGTPRLIIRDTAPDFGGAFRCAVITGQVAVPTTPGTYVVTDTTDTLDFTDPGLTLREAVALANADGLRSTVTLADDTTYELNRCDDAAEGNSALHVTGAESLQIQGRGSVIEQLCPSDGVVINGGPLEVDDTTIGPSGRHGILADAPVILRNSTIVGNRLGILSTAHVRLEDSRVIDNRPSTPGDGSIANVGGVAASSTIELVDSVVEGNVGLNVGGVQSTQLGGQIIAERTIIASNEAIAPDGIGGLTANNVRLTDSAIVANFGPGGSVDASITANIVRSTINASGTPAISAETIQMVGSVIDLSPGSTCRLSAPVPFQGPRFNFSETSGCVLPGGEVVDDLGLVQVQMPGVSTLLPQPIAGGPLIDVIPSSDCSEALDVRSVPRPQGAGCDAGAIELSVARPPGPDPDRTQLGNHFEPLVPTRVLDTRLDGPHSGPAAAGLTIDVDVAGQLGLPESATAVVMNLTAVRAAGGGFITAHPTGSPRLETSNLNVTEAGQTRTNTTAVPLGEDGHISIFTSVDAHILIDVAGYFVPQGVDEFRGRFRGIGPVRWFDTRNTGVPMRAGSTITESIDDIEELSGEFVEAVVINVTSARADARGFVTAYPADASRPLASSLNMPGGRIPVANLVIVPVGNDIDQAVSFFTSVESHIVVDLVGYFGGDESFALTEGLFVPVTPTRWFDTRESEPDRASSDRMTIALAEQPELPDPGDVDSLFVNLAGIRAADRAFVTMFPTGQTQPETSSLNLAGTGDTRSNGAVVTIGSVANDDGSFEPSADFFRSEPLHLAVDVFGYFLPGN